MHAADLVRHSRLAVGDVRQVELDIYYPLTSFYF